MTKIEFLYFEGCPSYKVALENLKEVLNSEDIDSEIKLIAVDSPDDAEKFQFQGSPSIRVNGIDLEDRDEECSFNCRIYTIDGKMTGIPTKDFIRDKIKSIIQNQN